MNTKQEVILKGKIKFDISKGTSVNGDDFYRVPINVTEIVKQADKEISDSIMIVFWIRNFTGSQLEIIKNLKENQLVMVHGQLGGRENGLLRVTKLELLNEEGGVEQPICFKNCSVHCS